MSEKKTTVRDLKTFIDAVEFASDQEEWVPSARQWKRIRQMIEDLEEVVEKAPAPPAVYPQTQPPAGPLQFAPSSIGPAVPQYTPQYSMPQGGMPQVNNPLLASHGQVPVRTPDIDTNGKPYTSSFAL